LPILSRNPESEVALIAATQRGDPNALGQLYDRYADLVYGAAYRVLASTSDAEDILQDVFVGLPEALRTYDERGRFDSWLKRVVIRAALMHVRSASRRREEPIDAVTHEMTSEDSDVADRIHMRDAIRSLPDHLRVVFMLKEVEGYSHAEIAELIGITPNASAARLFRAWKLLRGAARKT
jgi:RNA polymerase sigma-70 factor (ECF subfamily)